MQTKRDMTQYEVARHKRFYIAAVLILVCIPLTIFVGVCFLGDRKYMFISLLIILYTLLPFFMVFERRRPRARELVMIAVMSALAAFGTLACSMMIPFQAGTALVIVAGISMGPESGFLVGAIARFVCNFFLGQGPWTPWQMFCWGILGFLAGVVFNKVDLEKMKSRSFQIVRGPVLCILCAIGAAYLSYRWWGKGPFLGWRLYIFGAIGLLVGLLIQRDRLPIDDLTLSLFGLMSTFIIYGGIMNICTMVMSSAIDRTQIDMSWKSLTALYLSGVPYDFTHALGTAFFLFLFGEKVIRKIERVKIKYGMYR